VLARKLLDLDDIKHAPIRASLSGLGQS